MRALGGGAGRGARAAAAGLGVAGGAWRGLDRRSALDAARFRLRRACAAWARRRSVIQISSTRSAARSGAARQSAPSVPPHDGIRASHMNGRRGRIIQELGRCVSRSVGELGGRPPRRRRRAAAEPRLAGGHRRDRAARTPAAYPVSRPSRRRRTTCARSRAWRPRSPTTKRVGAGPRQQAAAEPWTLSDTEGLGRPATRPNAAPPPPMTAPAEAAHRGLRRDMIRRATPPPRRALTPAGAHSATALA